MRDVIVVVMVAAVALATTGLSAQRRDAAAGNSGFTRIFQHWPPFAQPTPHVKAALLEMGRKGGVMDARDNLAAGPIELITNPALRVNNPDSAAHTAGATFMGQFFDHDMTFDTLLHEFLPQFVAAPMVGDVLTNGGRFYPTRTSEAAIPIEFQTAYRFGHSLVRPSYRANFTGAGGGQFFAMLFDGGQSGEPTDLRGGARGSRRFVGGGGLHRSAACGPAFDSQPGGAVRSSARPGARRVSDDRFFPRRRRRSKTPGTNADVRPIRL